MSLYFDLVINCDLREDTPPDLIDAIRSLTDRNFEVQSGPQLMLKWANERGEYTEENAWEYFGDKHFLAPDPARDTISNFTRKHRTTIPLENNREVHRYVLQYAGRWLHDDWFYEHHLPFVYWLATVAHDPYIGYYKETDYDFSPVNHLRVLNRQMNLVKV